jgi:uncharacterized membrane protein
MSGVLDWLLGGGFAPTGELVWATPVWLTALAGLTAGAAWLLALVRDRSRSPGLLAAEFVFWGLALVVLAVAVAGPSWVESDGRTEPGKLVVLVDGSASMAVLEGGAARSDAVAPLLDELRKSGGEVEVFTFDEDLRGGAPTEFVGRGSDLGVALQSIADRNLGQQLRGVVVVTDGIDRGSLRRELRAAVEVDLVGAGLAPPLPGPLTVYQIGDADGLTDLAVDDVVSGGFAFLRTPFQLTAHIRGAAARTVPVTLSREGRLVAKKSVTLDDQGRATVVFEVIPRNVGRFAWQVSVPVDAADAVPGNNLFPVVIRVVRDRTRVLQVSGSPSYDQKFLRLFLKEDPSVDLVSFFILRTHEDMISGWRPRELSLIEFPYERLFSEDLSTFDLVVLQNFNYGPYFDRNAVQLLGNLAAYVGDGGALVMTGGDRSFDLGDYANTPIADVLPLTLGVAARKVDEAPFRPGLTAAGRVHPITRMAANDEQSHAMWESLPEMDGLNLVGGLAADSAVLLAHPTAVALDGTPAPVLAVREVGRGRTMALTVDASWRWSFSEAAVGRGNQAYLRFWKNSMRWLVADPEDRRVVVSPSRENVLLGDEVRLVVQVRDAGYGPVVSAKLTGTVRSPDGSSQPFEATTNAIGEATVPLTPSQQGAHRVVVRAGAGPSNRGETVFAVTERDPELTEIRPDGAFLKQLVALYDDAAAYRGPGDTDGPLVNDAAQRAIPERRQTHLATAPLVAILFGLFASLAWWARRRSGGR